MPAQPLRPLCLTRYSAVSANSSVVAQSMRAFGMSGCSAKPTDARQLRFRARRARWNVCAATRCADAFGDLQRLFLRDAHEQDQEFLAAPTQQFVLGAVHALQQLGNLYKYTIAGGVAVAVVDLLEVVQIEQQERRPHAVARAAREQPRDVLEHETAVAQSGQRIGFAGLFQRQIGLPQAFVAAAERLRAFVDQALQPLLAQPVITRVCSHSRRDDRSSAAASIQPPAPSAISYQRGCISNGSAPSPPMPPSGCITCTWKR